MWPGITAPASHRGWHALRSPPRRNHECRAGEPEALTLPPGTPPPGAAPLHSGTAATRGGSCRIERERRIPIRRRVVSSRRAAATHEVLGQVPEGALAPAARQRDSGGYGAVATGGTCPRTPTRRTNRRIKSDPIPPRMCCWYVAGHHGSGFAPGALAPAARQRATRGSCAVATRGPATPVAEPALHNEAVIGSPEHSSESPAPAPDSPSSPPHPRVPRAVPGRS